MSIPGLPSSDWNITSVSSAVNGHMYMFRIREGVGSERRGIRFALPDTLDLWVARLWGIFTFTFYPCNDFWTSLFPSLKDLHVFTYGLSNLMFLCVCF